MTVTKYFRVAFVLCCCVLDMFVFGLQCNSTYSVYNGWTVNTVYEQTPARSFADCASVCSRRKCEDNSCVSATFKATTKVCLLSTEMASGISNVNDPAFKTVALPSPANNEPVNRGTEFYIGFSNNLSGSVPALHFVAPGATVTANVVIPHITVDETFTFTGATYRPYSATIQNTVDNAQVTNMGIHVTTDTPVTLYKSSNVTGSFESSIVLPVTGLGRQYIVQTCPVADGMFMIISTQASTTVNVTIGGALTSYLMPLGGTLYRETTGLNGTLISADADIVVTAGARCVTIRNSACDQVDEILYPESVYGIDFVVANMYPRGEHTIGIVAREPQTGVRILDAIGNLLQSFSMNRGDTAYYQYINNETLSVESDLPIQVTQYGHGGMGSAPYGDPSMMMIPPVNKFGTSYDLYIPSGTTLLTTLHVLSVTADDELNIRLNDVVPTFEYASTVSSRVGTFRVAYVFLNTDVVYTITHVNNVPFGAYAYGGKRDAEFSMSLGWTS